MQVLCSRNGFDTAVWPAAFRRKPALRKILNRKTMFIKVVLFAAGIRK